MIVFDLDGTLADCTHRLQYIKRDVPDWDMFFLTCSQDTPIVPMVNLFKMIQWRTNVEIWTGRSEVCRRVTELWLGFYQLDYEALLMRPEGDHRPDYKLKEEWLHSYKHKPTLAFEDRSQVVAMWRANGVPCCQVAPGNF